MRNKLLAGAITLAVICAAVGALIAVVNNNSINTAATPEAIPGVDLVTATVNTGESGCDEAKYPNDCWLPLGAQPNTEATVGTNAIAVDYSPDSDCWGNANPKRQKGCWPVNHQSVTIICQTNGWLAVRVPDSEVRGHRSNLTRFDADSVYGYASRKWFDLTDEPQPCAAG